MNSQPRTVSRIVIGLVVASVVAAEPLAAQDIPEWIQKAESEWYDALVAGDELSLRRMFAEDAAFVLQDRTVRGRDMLNAFKGAIFRAVQIEACDWSIEGVLSVDRLATVVTQSTCTGVVRQGESRPMRSQVLLLKVYERQADGTWLIVRVDGQLFI